MRREIGGGSAIAMVALLWTTVAAPDAGYAAGIDWETSGAFQSCLETRAQKWIAARVELVVSNDPAAGDIDDAAVAGWTVQALEACKVEAGRSDPASEQRFARYMARWREHIDAAAQAIKRRLSPD
jgi:hypothetical protein